MPHQNSESSSEALQRQQALSRWDNEGGAGPAVAPASNREQVPTPDMSNADLVALRIREEAAVHGVPVRENRALARALHAAVEVGEEIPADLFRAVAEVLAAVFAARTSRGLPAQRPRSGPPKRPTRAGPARRRKPRKRPTAPRSTT